MLYCARPPVLFFSHTNGAGDGGLESAAKIVTEYKNQHVEIPKKIPLSTLADVIFPFGLAATR